MRFGGGAKLLGGANCPADRCQISRSPVLIGKPSYGSPAGHSHRYPNPCWASAACDAHIAGPSIREPRESSHHFACIPRNYSASTDHRCRPSSARMLVARGSSCASSCRRAAASRPCNTQSRHLPWWSSPPKSSSAARLPKLRSAEAPLWEVWVWVLVSGWRAVVSWWAEIEEKLSGGENVSHKCLAVIIKEIHKYQH